VVCGCRQFISSSLVASAALGFNLGGGAAPSFARKLRTGGPPYHFYLCPFVIFAIYAVKSSVLSVFPPVERRLVRHFIPAQSNAAMHKVCISVRRLDARATVMPTPLKSAIYAAKQTGHLGSKIKVAPGMIHRASSPARRQCGAGRSGLWPVGFVI
jgi:hypothetical protein